MKCLTFAEGARTKLKLELEVEKNVGVGEEGRRRKRVEISPPVVGSGRRVRYYATWGDW